MVDIEKIWGTRDLIWVNKLELSSQRLILNDNEVALVENKHISPPRLTSNVLEMSKKDHQMIEIA